MKMSKSAEEFIVLKACVLSWAHAWVGMQMKAYSIWLYYRWLDEGEDDGKIVRELSMQDGYMDDILAKRNVS